jgi:hypothetical protein
MGEYKMNMGEICNQCSKQCPVQSDASGKSSGSWMTINTGGDITHLCSYICYRSGRDKYPKGLWDLVQNKEDFDDIRPVSHGHRKKPSFQYMNHEGLLQLSEEEVTRYYDTLDNQVTLNPNISEVYDEQEKEDRWVRELEEEWETGSGKDDYYE